MCWYQYTYKQHIHSRIVHYNWSNLPPLLHKQFILIKIENVAWKLTTTHLTPLVIYASQVSPKSSKISPPQRTERQRIIPSDLLHVHDSSHQANQDAYYTPSRSAPNIDSACNRNIHRFNLHTYQKTCLWI